MNNRHRWELRVVMQGHSQGSFSANYATRRQCEKTLERLRKKRNGALIQGAAAFDTETGTNIPLALPGAPKLPAGKIWWNSKLEDLADQPWDPFK